MKIYLLATLFVTGVSAVALGQTARNPNNDEYLKRHNRRYVPVYAPVTVSTTTTEKTGDDKGIKVTERKTETARIIVTTADVTRALRTLSGSWGNLAMDKLGPVFNAVADTPARKQLAADFYNALNVIDKEDFTDEDNAIFHTLANELANLPLAYQVLLELIEEYQPDSVRISIIGIAGATAVDGLDKSAASVSIGISLAWGDHLNRRNGTYHLYQRNSLYVLFNPASAVSNDTSTIAKTFLFPEISRRDFVMGYERIFPFATTEQLDFTNNEYRPANWSLFTEFSTSHYDTGILSFRTYDLTAGLKFSFHGEQAGLGFGLQVIPYYSLIAVEQKHWEAVDLAIIRMGHDSLDVKTHKGIPPTIHTFGVNVKASVSVFEIFANFKYILNDKINNNPNITNNDFKNTVVTFGVLINPSVWSFNRGRGPRNRICFTK